MRAAKARYFSVTRADQVFLPVAVADLLELQGRVLRIVFQQRNCLSAVCVVGGQSMVILPEIRVRDGSLYALERLCVSGLVVGQSAIYTCVDASGVKIGFKLGVDLLWVALVKPPIQSVNLLRRQRIYGAFDFLYPRNENC